MIQNIKVDIVYYMTATDFEFEFNLGSCCHMRLLNDKAKDKKAYLNSLARAVSRSKIILCVGPVFGEDGLIAVTSAAIGKGLKAIDNKSFGISDDSKIEIIDGAVPLVTPEGYFGGCIIESGPQTIVILSENRTIRKSIMKTLVHPYIEDMSLMQVSGSAPSLVSKEEPQQTEEVIETQEPLTVTDTEEPEETDEVESEFVEENEEVEAEPEISESEPEEEPQIEPEATEEPADNIEFDFSVDTDYSGEQTELPEETDDLYVEEDASYNKEKGSKGINISIIIITALLTLVILGLCYLLIFLPLKNGVSTTEYIGQLFKTVSSTTSV